jgi:hypothetical protein
LSPLIEVHNLVDDQQHDVDVVQYDGLGHNEQGGLDHGHHRMFRLPCRGALSRLLLSAAAALFICGFVESAIPDEAGGGVPVTWISNTITIANLYRFTLLNELPEVGYVSPKYISFTTCLNLFEMRNTSGFSSLVSFSSPNLDQFRLSPFILVRTSFLAS